LLTKRQSLFAERDRILATLKTKYKVGSQSTKLVTAKEAMDLLIQTLEEKSIM
jgi:hypothetical protein